LYGYWTHITDQDRAGGVLLGKVAVEGEMLPWQPILVSLRCKDATVYTTQSDPRGDFAVIPNRIPGALSLQGDRQRQMQTYFEGCVLEGFLTGFRSTKITLSQHILRDDPNVGTITLSRDSQARATAMSASSQNAPGGATKHWTKAGEYMMAEKADKAQRELEKAVQAYPGFADAWYELGRLEMQSSPRDARACFEKASAADPNFVPPYEQLAALAAQQQDWQGVIDNTNRFLQLDPDGSMAVWYYNALANFQLGYANPAQSSAETLMKADPLHNIRNGEQLLAAILARKADYTGALAHLQNCLTYIVEGPDANLLKEEIAQLQKKISPPSR
jgi:Tfp pilus assembly protein PilF